MGRVGLPVAGFLTESLANFCNFLYGTQSKGDKLSSVSASLACEGIWHLTSLPPRAQSAFETGCREVSIHGAFQDQGG